MRTNSLAVLGAAIVAVSCGGSPAPKPGPPVLVGLSIVGPITFSPDETGVPYTANGRLSDGTTENYTTKVTWNSSNLQVASISSGGLASGKSSGEATISASTGRFVAGVNVTVIPGGTYRLIGKVTESGFPVTGAQVVVVAGHGSGLAATTDFSGQYRLYGVRGDIEVKVTKAGYEPLMKTMTVTMHDVLDFPDLRQVGAPPALAGTYTMTIAASLNCPTTSTQFTPALPDYARQRSYTAAVVQTGPRLDVTLSGADFLIQNGSSNIFTGYFAPDGLTFDLGGTFYYYDYFLPDYRVVEKLPNSEFFTFWGKVSAVMSKTSISGPLGGGGLMVFTGSTVRPVIKGVCYLGGQFSLVPQTAATRRR